jgi:ABC-type transport system involved in cytochrome c biogenesis permease subunit
MFKERLSLTLKILGSMLLLGIVALGLSYAIEWISQSDLTREYILYGVLIAIVVILIHALIQIAKGTSKFLKWLILEPYREYQRSKLK